MSYAHQSNAALAGLFGGGNVAQNAAQSQSYAQALAQAQNYQSQSPTALAQAYQAQLGMNSINGSAAQAYTAARNNAQAYNRGREATVVGDTFPPATSMELDHPAYDAPVSVLIDMWVVRFGNDWVDIETIDNDDFFRLAFKRLKAMGELEVHYLTDRSRYVCRKPK